MEYLKKDINKSNPEILENYDVKEDFGLAESAVYEGAELAKNYLQFTKIYTPDFSSCNLNDILKETASSAKSLSANFDIEDFTVDLKLDENIKKNNLDASKLKMAFYNLCKNSVEAFAEEAVSLKISFKLQDEKSGL